MEYFDRLFDGVDVSLKEEFMAVKDDEQEKISRPQG